MAPGRSLRIPAIGTSAVVAAAVFYVAYEDGSYSVASRSAIAIAVWWTILAGVVARVWPVERIPKGAVVTGSLLAAFAVWDLASTAWAASAEKAYTEFDRTALYLGVYVLVVVSTDRRRRANVVDGLTAAIAAIGVAALLSRLFPGLFPNRGLSTSLPNASTRLSFPLDYWNGLGIFVALAFPLLLYWMLGGDRARRVAALGLVPALGAVVYLTSSRGAVVAHTAMGKVEVGIGEGVAAWLDLHTGFGTVRSDLETTGRPGPGEDVVEVKARSAMGDITVQRAATPTPLQG